MIAKRDSTTGTERVLDAVSMAGLAAASEKMAEKAADRRLWRKRRDALLVYLLCHTGLRLAEALRLQAKDVTDRGLVFPRKIDWPEKTHDPLFSYFDFCGHFEDDFVFWSNRMRRDPLAYSTAKLAVTRIASRSGYAGVTARTIRRSFGRQVERECRGDVEKVCRVMGYSRVDYATRYY
jgi:integrase